MRNLTQVSVFHGFPFVKMKMPRFAPVRMGWPERCSGWRDLPVSDAKARLDFFVSFTRTRS
jgi:hypothetical protein